MSTCASAVIAICSCGSSSTTNDLAKTNANTVNSVPFSRRENAYTLAQADLGIAPLKEFVGKTASEMKLWQNKDVVRRLKKLMGAEFATMTRFWQTETPLKKFADTLILTGCERDNCSDNRYVIFLSTSEGLVSVVHIGKDTIREWKTRGTLDLPLPVAEELAEMMRRN